MQMCPNCDRIYDESEYSRCPYCSGEIECVIVEEPFKKCPNCDGIMYWYDDCWGCTNCGLELYTDKDDNDGMLEREKYNE